MNDWIFQIGTPVLTAVLGLFSGKYLTKREKKKEDLQVVENATSGLLNSIKLMSDTINEVTEKYKQEQAENLKLLQEIKGLKEKEIDLQTEIHLLRTQMTRLEEQQKLLLEELQEYKTQKQQNKQKK